MLKNNEPSLIVLVVHPSILNIVFILMEVFGDFRLLLLLFISPSFLFDAAVGIAILQLRMICEHEKLLYLRLYLVSIFKADLSFLCLPVQLVVKLLSLLAQY